MLKINHRIFILLAGIAITILTLTSMTSCQKESPKKPNIVLIMADDLGWGELGCYGQTKIETPNIDKLASEGMKFTQFYAGSAVCAPSRCNLMTGKHGGHAYIRNNGEIKDKVPGIFGGQSPIPAEEPTIAKTLKAAGYTTGCFGKWGLGAVGTTGDPLNQGFDKFYGYNCQRHAHNLYPKYLVSDSTNEKLEGNTRGITGETYAPQRIADEMLKFIKENKDKPFFVYYPTVLPHLALQAPEKAIDQYRGRWEDEPYVEGPYLPHPTPKACYAAMITFIDTQVGRLMAKLKKHGLDENTIVIFTSDNGATYLKKQVDYEFFNSVGPLRGLKGSLYEGGIRVPLIARWPNKITAGTESDHRGVNYDIPATLSELVGVKFDANTDGVSFLPTLLNRTSKQNKSEYLFWDFSGYGGQLAVRMGKWKGIKKDIKKNPDAPLELYNLEIDIAESNNVVNEFPDITKKIEGIMISGRTEPELEKFRFGKYSLNE